MNPIPPGEEPGTGSTSVSPARPQLAPAVLRVLSRSTGQSELERLMTTLALHPEGPGFQRFHLLLWDTSAGLLHPRIHAELDVPRTPLIAALEQARLPSAEGERRVSRASIDPRRLEGVVLAAWQGGDCRMGEGIGDGAPWNGAVQIGAGRLSVGGLIRGLWVGEWREGSENGERMGAVSEFATLVEAAWSAVEHSSELARERSQLVALAELARATVSPANLAEVLHSAARLATQAGVARGSALWLASPQGPRLEVAHGTVGQRERMARAFQPIAAHVMAHSKVRTTDQATDEPLLSPDSAAKVSGFAVLPLCAFGRTLGAIAIYDQIQKGQVERCGIEPSDLEFLSAIADLVAVAIDHANRFNELRQAEGKNRELVDRLRKQEGLAALGEMAGRMVQEARNPLTSIRAFARRIYRSLSTEDSRREYVEIVMRESDRLEKLLGEQHAYATATPSTLHLESMNEVVQETLQRVSETLVRRRVRLLKKLAPDLPPLLLDPERVRQVVSNIVGHALEAVSVGGRVRLETRRAGQHVWVEIAHDGTRDPGDSLDQLFVPFASSRPGGPSLGLAVAQRIVREHGGEIRVRSEGEWSTIVSFTVPIRDNQDRRNVGADRRRRSDRRSRLPEK